VIRPGEPWGSPTSAPADIEVSGDDAALAAAARLAPGALLRFVPDAASDLARAVGIPPGGLAATAGTALPMDALSVTVSPPAAPIFACNMCVFGVPPDRLRWSSPSFAVEIELDGRTWFSGRASTIIVASGQFLRGLDVVPRGHPGDGKAEIHVYELKRRERRPMRARLATGAHLPHPRIRTRTAARVTLSAPRRPALEIDGVAGPASSRTTLEVVPGAYRLLL
jgi:hypothetical protein